MKRSLTALLIAFVAFVAVPVANAQMRWGASAGINVNSMKFKQDLFQVSQGVGESLGVRGEMMFPGIGFGIELGLYYQQQGSISETRRYGRHRDMATSASICIMSPYLLILSSSGPVCKGLRIM